MPSTDNANYLWIQLFYSALNKTGKAGFVMANSAADARGSEMEIRKKLLQAKAVDVMISIGSNFFYTVTLPCTLWFFDKAKKGTKPAPVEVSAPRQETAAGALDRVNIPQEAIDRIGELMSPGASLVISDKGLGGETGKGTDFIVLTR
jgi:hypothetical protein